MVFAIAVSIAVASVILFTNADRGDHARTAASVEHCHNPQGLFVGRESDHIFTHQLEPQRA